MIILNPENKEILSVKTSVKRSHGPFPNKEFTADHALYHKDMSTLILNDDLLFQASFPDESYIGIKAPDFNEGQLIRSLKKMKGNDYFVSLSSIIDNQFGRTVANLNGFKGNRLNLIQKLIAPKLGKFSGRIYSRYGAIDN